MELFIKTAFWMVTLCITLSGYPTASAPTEKPILTNDYNINLMREQVKCPQDSRFYLPEYDKSECFTAALECILKELDGTAKAECDDPNGRIDEALESLHNKLSSRPDYSPANNISSDCACERWREDGFHKFLEKYESLLEKEKSIA